MSEFEKILGYKFSNTFLMHDALTHTSFSSTRFELLEFLGDRVLGLVVAHLLVLEDHGSEIKDVASKFSNLVSAKFLIKVAHKWQIEKFLKHEIQTLSQKVLVDAVEAIIGAVYSDSGYTKIYELIAKLWSGFLNEEFFEPKMFLQEFSQSKGFGCPVYSCVATNGPHHLPIYTMQVAIEKLGVAIGDGNSKQEASKNAAQNLLNKLKQDGIF